MTPTQLRAYIAIVRHGTAKSAATELGVSEAAISGHVAALRKEFDDVLFARTANGLSYTPGGLRLATRAVELLGLQDQTRNEVRSAANGRRVLRLAVSSLFAEYAAPGLIELFSQRARDLDVEMSEHLPADLPGVLLSRAADVAIGPKSELLPATVQAKDVIRYQLAVVAGPGHQFAQRRVSRADLGSVQWYLGPSALDATGVAAKMLSFFKVPEANQRIFQSHAAALIEARSSGLALAPVQYVVDEVREGRLVRIETRGAQADGVWSLFSLGLNQATPVAAELIRFVSTPRAMQAMLSGSGANVSHFRPSIHVTLWS